jgi:hypothetical protein
VDVGDAVLVELDDDDGAGAGSWRPAGAAGGDMTDGKRAPCEPPPSPTAQAPPGPPPWPVGELHLGGRTVRPRPGEIYGDGGGGRRRGGHRSREGS